MCWTDERVGAGQLPISATDRSPSAELWDRIAAVAEHQPLTPAQAAELDRRLEDYRSHPETSIPWEQAREQMRRR